MREEIDALSSAVRRRRFLNLHLRSETNYDSDKRHAIALFFSFRPAAILGFVEGHTALKSRRQTAQQISACRIAQEKEKTSEGPCNSISIRASEPALASSAADNLLRACDDTTFAKLTRGLSGSARPKAMKEDGFRVASSTLVARRTLHISTPQFQTSASFDRAVTETTVYSLTKGSCLWDDAEQHAGRR